MIRIYFSEFTTGKLRRLPYLGYALLLSVIFFAFGLATVAAIAGAEAIVGGDLMAAQDTIRKSLAMPYLIILAAFVLALFIAGMNIAAKRFSDMGLPGWVVVVGVIIVSFVISRYISQNVSGLFSTLVVAALLFIPSNALKGKV
ncbi:MAG: DUF805 domain-containing protein [Rhizobiaceae bacterium]|nr:DUF805 domain-containing protein [Rhizobiaceae bacterium]